MMENEKFGTVRDSMTSNQLLQKAELGKIKKRCYSLPGPDFTYGQSSFLREGGVAEAVGHWQTVGARAHQRKLESNFVALNREAVKSGLVTATEHQAFRNTHKIWRPINEGRVKQRCQHLPQDATFGICTRSSCGGSRTRGPHCSGGTSRPRTPLHSGSCHSLRRLVLTLTRSTVRSRDNEPSALSGRTRSLGAVSLDGASITSAETPEH
ncbi:cilia- and flagella-associated protein 77 isoform X2 [Rhinoderma darwinii]|uniref:cilia- and flagella-associated protein 77 isoform X2 n=1 Tax=Rhinoderma darwinii TaxID=43563 RepID=UPI003F67FF63